MYINCCWKYSYIPSFIIKIFPQQKHTEMVKSWNGEKRNLKNTSNDLGKTLLWGFEDPSNLLRPTETGGNDWIPQLYDIFLGKLFEVAIIYDIIVSNDDVLLWQ